MTGGEDDECGIRGCSRDAVKKEICTVCNEAYFHGFNMGKKESSAVRGRQEIQEEIEHIQERLEYLGQRVAEINDGQEANSENIYDAVVSVRKAIAGLKVLEGVTGYEEF